jgi:hypothetical protein
LVIEIAKIGAAARYAVFYKADRVFAADATEKQRD